MTAKSLQEIATHFQKEQKPDPAELIWADNLIPIVFGLSSFGGSITFTVIPSRIQSQAISLFNDEAIRYFLALAWLFFALALGSASISQLVVALNREQIKEMLAEEAEGSRGSSAFRKTFAGLWFRCFGLILQVLVLLAFLFLGLVVVAYAPNVGFIAVAFTLICLVGSSVFWARSFFH